MKKEEKYIDSKHLKRIFSGEINSQYFLHGKSTYGDILSLAAGYIDEFQKLPAGSVICICTERRDLIVAAFVASLFSDSLLILPFSLSAAALQDVSDATSFQYYVGDDQNILSGNAVKIPEKSLAFDVANYSFKKNDAPVLKLFTGGSTGKPKIWTKTVSAIFEECIFLVDKFSISHDDLFCSTVPPYHIYGFYFSLLIPFIAGSSIIDETITFPNAIKSTLLNYPVTVYVSVPIQYKLLNKYDAVENSLRIAFSSAGPLREEDARDFNRITGASLYEVYGSTETGGIATRCRAKDETFFTPFESVLCRYAEERLAVSSPYLSLEIELDSEGFFLTNDAVKHVNDGFLTVGRVDSIVKIGGKRVDLNQVQEKINDIPETKDSLVVVLPQSGTRETEIVAIIVSDADVSYIKRELRDVLEPYAIPKRMKKVENIPYKTSGKIDLELIKLLFSEKG